MTALDDDLLLALDPGRFAARVGLTLDDWQRDAVRSPARQQLWTCSRQSGKSSTAAVKALHVAVYQPDSLILCLSPSQRQSGELFRKIAGFFGRMGGTVSATSETKLTLELANGSRIVALPGKEETIRGFSGVSLLICDEGARISDSLYAAIRPMLAVSQGQLLALSTPWGKRGWYSDAWHDGGPAWERTLIPATACPRIDPQWLAEEEKTIGRFWFEQEYLCRFLDNESQAFRWEDITSAFSETATTWEL